MEATLRNMLEERIKSKYGTNPEAFNIVQKDLGLANKQVGKFTLLS